MAMESESRVPVAGERVSEAESQDAWLCTFTNLATFQKFSRTNHANSK